MKIGKLGFNVKTSDYEYEVRAKNPFHTSCYFSDDLDDCLETAKAMKADFERLVDMQPMKAWTSSRPYSRTVKTLTRLQEMNLDHHLQGYEMIQFCSDLKVYGLYEAVLMTSESYSIMQTLLANK